MATPALRHIKTITEFHRFRGLPKPEHPMISVINFELITGDFDSINQVNGFYSIGLKRDFTGRMIYGQQEYDFDEGVMTFLAPGQVLRIENDSHTELKHSGWLLLIHPDFLWNTPLAKTIKHYEFFDYSIHEALFLSSKEEKMIEWVMKTIETEYRSNIDKFSQNLIIAQLEFLLTYADRFYHRQFLTRKITNHKILEQLENILTDYFKDDEVLKKGLPSVQFIAEQLHVSPGYLRSLLKVLTGQNTQQHIHNKVIEKAKEMLSGTTLSISEIAYHLGFEHPQSFSKLFKTKTNQSPLKFRLGFN